MFCGIFSFCVLGVHLFFIVFCLISSVFSLFGIYLTMLSLVIFLNTLYVKETRHRYYFI